MRRFLLGVGVLASIYLLSTIRPPAPAVSQPIQCSATAAETPQQAMEILTCFLATRAVISSGQQFFAEAKYVGIAKCAECHSKQNEEWSRTWHSKILRAPSPEIILGDFNNRIVVIEEVRVVSGAKINLKYKIGTSRRQDKYFFTMIDGDDSKNNRELEVALVVGGTYDQQYHIKVGDKYFPAPLRWSAAAGDWQIEPQFAQHWVATDGTSDGRPRKPEELDPKRFAEPKCMGCHTTGFRFVKDETTQLWSMQGEGEFAVGCERCHGPASKHIEQIRARIPGQVATPTTIINPLRHLTPLQETQVCGQCHSRQTNKYHVELSFPERFLPPPNAEDKGFLPGDTDLEHRTRFWSYSGAPDPAEYSYFWPNDWAKRSREEWQDFTKSAHFTTAGMSCSTCHTFHGTWYERQLRLKPQELKQDPQQDARDLCVNCHRTNGWAKRPNYEMYSDSQMARTGVTCVDCHMPLIGFKSSKTAKGDPPWDAASHTLIVPSPALEANRSYQVRNACSACHRDRTKMANGTPIPPMSIELMDREILSTQQITRALIDEVQQKIARVPNPQGEAAALIEQARRRVDFVVLDGSMGVHDRTKAANLLEEAKQLVDRACATGTPCHPAP